MHSELSRRTSTVTKFQWLVLPQLLLMFGFAVYLMVGAVVFTMLDERLANHTYEDLIVFELATLSTIGYGNIAPTTNSSRAFCILFSVLGIPLFILLLANLGKYTTKGYWLIHQKCTKQKNLNAFRGDKGLPIVVSLLGFFLAVLLCGEMVEHNGDRDFVDDIYFSFISFSTVGFGDKVPLTKTPLQLALVVLFLIAGIVCVSAIFNTLNCYLRKMHYFGRRFRGARDVPVWMGGRSMPVSQLLTIVAQEFDASPREIREVLRDLDCLLLSVIERKKEEEVVPLVVDIEDFDVFD